MSIYHKFHTYYTAPLIDRPVKQEIVTFSSFGVTFGMLVCFDAEFRSPINQLLQMGASHIIMTTDWVNSPPFFTATMFQQGLSRAYGIVLIVANNGKSCESSGSGIYVKGSPLTVAFNDRNEAEDFFLSAVIPGAEESMDGLAIVDRLQNIAGTIPSPSLPCQYESASLVKDGRCFLFETGGEPLDVSITMGDTTCKLHAKFPMNATPSPYVLWVSDGNYKYSNFSGHVRVQSCAVFFCNISTKTNNRTQYISCPQSYAPKHGYFSALQLTVEMQGTPIVFPMVGISNAEILPRNKTQIASTVSHNRTSYEMLFNETPRNASLFSALLYGLWDTTTPNLYGST